MEMKAGLQLRCYTLCRRMVESKERIVILLLNKSSCDSADSCDTCSMRKSWLLGMAVYFGFDFTVVSRCRQNHL
jgi:hypothetical protein